MLLLQKVLQETGDPVSQMLPYTKHLQHTSAHLQDCSLQQTHLKHTCSFRALSTERNKALRRRERCIAKAQFKQDSLQLFSPSKINLFLRVMRRRDDGYHDLASLFHVIDFGDNLEFNPISSTEQDELSCNWDDIPLDSSNLVIKALDLFRRRTSSRQHYRIQLEKSVPHAAGLGGGSANAATALWAANELSGRPATNAQLQDWAGDIGSDISVFFSQGAAYCTSRGEVVEDVESPLPPSTPLLLVKPPVGLATPAVFRALDLDARSTADPQQLLAGLQDRGALPELCVNDLEQAAFDVLPSLLQLKERLRDESEGRFTTVLMTGSGSTIVCVGSDVAPAFLDEAEYAGMLVVPARLITRKGSSWYEPSKRMAAVGNIPP